MRTYYLLHGEVGPGHWSWIDLPTVAAARELQRDMQSRGDRYCRLHEYRPDAHPYLEHLVDLDTGEMCNVPSGAEPLALCELCAEAGQTVEATERVPEPQGGCFGCTPGTFSRGVPLCAHCAKEWRSA